jgi:hypothetical protein
MGVLSDMISRHDSDGMEANWGGYFEMSGLELVSPRDFLCS